MFTHPAHPQAQVPNTPFQAYQVNILELNRQNFLLKQQFGSANNEVSCVFVFSAFAQACSSQTNERIPCPTPPSSPEPDRTHACACTLRQC